MVRVVIRALRSSPSVPDMVEVAASEVDGDVGVVGSDNRVDLGCDTKRSRISGTGPSTLKPVVMIGRGARFVPSTPYIC